jgi:hypothetical protein
MAGIPTIYRGVQFRSRIEARWAAFFQIAKLRWMYEPLDLAGYIPDFLVWMPYSPDIGPFLVEIKSEIDGQQLIEAAQKIDRSGWRGRAIIFGASPDVGLIDNAPLGDASRWAPIADEWSDMLSAFAGLSRKRVASLWIRAGNAVQWKSPVRR